MFGRRRLLHTGLIAVGAAIVLAACRPAQRESEPTGSDTAQPPHTDAFGDLRRANTASPTHPTELDFRLQSLDHDFFRTRIDEHVFPPEALLGAVMVASTGLDVSDISGGMSGDVFAGTDDAGTANGDVAEFTLDPGQRVDGMITEAHAFSTLDLDVAAFAGAAVGIAVVGEEDRRIEIEVAAVARVASARFVHDGEDVVNESMALPEAFDAEAPFTLRSQLVGRGVNVWVVQDETPHHLMFVKLRDHWDFRASRGVGANVGYFVRSDSSATVGLAEMRTMLSGSGHADFRVASFEDGTPIQQGDFVTVLASVRGYDVGDSYQGIFRLDTTTGGVEMTGALFGLDESDTLMNDFAGHLMYDRTRALWVWTNTGHSTHPHARRNYLATFADDPREQVTYTEVSAIEMPSDALYEDFYPVLRDDRWTAVASKEASVTVLMEAPDVAGPWTVVEAAGDGETGPVIVRMGDEDHVLAGVERRFLVRSAATLADEGELQLDRSPEANRVWPVVFPVADAEGRPRWAMLTFDRFDSGGRYTYGRWHYYLAE